jgi:hypothetical protein
MDSARLATLLDEVAVLVRRAGAAAAVEAGCDVVDPDGRPLRYVLADGLRNRGFLVCASGGGRDASSAPSRFAVARARTGSRGSQSLDRSLWEAQGLGLMWTTG